MHYSYAIISTNGMNVSNEIEVGRILVQADILVPDSSPKLLGAVGLPQFTLYVQRGWHPERGATAECELEGTLARDPLRVFHLATGVDVNAATFNASALALVA